ncbi:hypothetical protein PG993_010741 [Apiospora rasikravindrae]|uniref:Uncharacterized protein n=1 Tax=Apiospora rasikravindrae TaxID=990691 RepID=A0ABR1SC57_9PEZI
MDYSNTTISTINTSAKLIWEGATLYAGSCEATDPTIRELDQQIIHNDIILFANGGVPYMPQGPALPNTPPAVDNGWQPYQNHLQDVAGIVQTAAAVGSQMTGYERWGAMTQPPPPLPETRHNSADQPAGRVSGVTGSSQTAATSQPSSASTSPYFIALASEWGAPCRNVHHPPENWRRAVPTAQQKKQYHQHQKQLHERGLVETKAAATAAAAAAAGAIMTTKMTATSPREEQNVDRMMAQDMPTARKELAQMGLYLQNVAQQQRMMVDDTLRRWMVESRDQGRR